MAVTDVSPGQEYAVCTLLKRLEDKIGVDSARTHYANNPHVGRILKTAHPCQISGRIGAPVARKCNYFWIKLLRHEHPSGLLIVDL
jgi:hypothetical protein